jgi:hypothetical protein
VYRTEVIIRNFSFLDNLLSSEFKLNKIIVRLIHKILFLFIIYRTMKLIFIFTLAKFTTTTVFKTHRKRILYN